MSSTIKKTGEDEYEITTKMKLTGSLLESEQAIREGLNEAGILATGESIKRFDTDGSNLKVGEVKYYGKGQTPEVYETPYGPVKVERHVYQTCAGGRSYCPLEGVARMVLKATPYYAKMISSKYSRMGATQLKSDLLESNGRSISLDYITKLSDYVSAIAEVKEETWDYDLPAFEEEVKTVSIGMDGTCVLMKNEGWREAVSGTISLYDGEGERLYTVYTGAPPEHGKQRFKERFTGEIERIKERFPDALYIGLADGAKENWTFLKPFVSRMTLDFYHVSEYVKLAAPLIWAKDKQEKLKETLHNLKHKKGAAKRFLNELEKVYLELKKKKDKETLGQVITYFENNYQKMNYGRNIKENLPIGSGVTEAACKVLVKQRLCQSGMRWKDNGMKSVLTLRALRITKGRWEEFWKKISQYGVPTIS